MGGGSGTKNSEGRLDHGGHWRSEQEWPLKRTLYTKYYLHSGDSLTTNAPNNPETPSKYSYDPDNPVPSISGNSSGLDEILPQPQEFSVPIPAMMRRRSLILHGGAHQAGLQGIFGCNPPYNPLSCRDDVLVFETEPLEQDLELTGPISVILWASSSSTDTDFTAKLLYIYPPSPDYPDGYHLNLSDGIIRARYRDFSGKSKPIEPGEIYRYEIILEPISTLFRAGHRIRLDISSSNFPRIDANPNTGEPVGQHTHTIVSNNTVYHDAIHPSHIVLPIIPS